MVTEMAAPGDVQHSGNLASVLIPATYHFVRENKIR